MTPLVVVFDVDVVLADFLESFKRLAHQMGKDPNTVYVGSDPPTQGADDTWVMGEKTGDHDVWRRIVTGKTFWASMVSSVDPSTWSRVRDLEAVEDVRLYFVTNRAGHDVKAQTEAWLRHRGLRHPTVLISPLKGEACRVLRADFHIDDKAGNAVHVSYHSPGTASYILDLPKNQFDHNVIGGRVRRVYSVDAFLDDVYARRTTAPR